MCVGGFWLFARHFFIHLSVRCSGWCLGVSMLICLVAMSDDCCYDLSCCYVGFSKALFTPRMITIKITIKITI